MGVGLCETCRHWSFANPDWEFDDIMIGECKAVKMREEIVKESVRHLADGRWDDAAEPLIKSALISAKAIAVDGSGYYAALRTTGEFGCVKHESKDIPA